MGSGRAGLRSDRLTAAAVCALILGLVGVLTVIPPVATAVAIAEPAVDLPPVGDLAEIRSRLAADPGAAESLEPDVREIPWATLRRLALLGGELPFAYGPVSGGELVRPLLAVTVDSVALSRFDSDAAARLLHHHGLGAGGGRVLYGCRCKENPVDVRLDGRAVVGWQELGGVVPEEGGLAFAPGLSVALEPRLSAWSGRWWASVSARFHGRAIDGGRVPADPFLYRDWPVPTGRPRVGTARLDDGRWRVDWPRVVAGVRLGHWSVAVGKTAVQVGPGHSGQLTLSSQAATFPAVTVRRNHPIGWRGFWRYLAPAQLLFRLGQVSEQDVTYFQGEESRMHRTSPVFGQWFVGWEWTSWWRFSLTLSALAAPREGESLWPFLPRILFPTGDVTWDEIKEGPVTDRIFGAGTEFRWRRAPWPVLPAAAGRVWGEYAGEDMNPHDFLPVPQISVPAAVVGVELVDPVWDLLGEYVETRHPKVLWYGNGGYPEGYSHDGWILGHPQAGAAETWLGLARWRPGAGHDELELKFRHTTWDMPARLPDRAAEKAVTLTWRRHAGGWLGEIAAVWVREDVGLGGVPTRTDHAAVRATVNP